MRSKWGALLVLALVLVTGFLAISCKKSSPAGPGTPADVTINIVGVAGANSYSPNPDTVTVGQTVAWHNIDGITHTATSNTGGFFDTGHLAGGSTSSPVTMMSAGSFPYHCAIHGVALMSGTLVVRP